MHEEARWRYFTSPQLQMCAPHPLTWMIMELAKSSCRYTGGKNTKCFDFDTRCGSSEAFPLSITFRSFVHERAYPSASPLQFLLCKRQISPRGGGGGHFHWKLYYIRVNRPPKSTLNEDSRGRWDHSSRTIRRWPQRELHIKIRKSVTFSRGATSKSQNFWNEIINIWAQSGDE